MLAIASLHYLANLIQKREFQEGGLNDQQCAACSWHHDGAVDEPSVAPLIARPEITVILDESASFTLRELSLRIHPNRGPPAILL